MFTLPHPLAAREYADQVLAGKIIAGKYVKLACQRFIRDLDRADIYFDEKAASKACRFMEALPHVKDRWAAKKQNLKLEPWQVFIECNLFGWKRTATGLRRFRESYEEVARKNGKSTRLAARGLYMLCADGEYGAEVYSGDQ